MFVNLVSNLQLVEGLDILYNICVHYNIHKTNSKYIKGINFREIQISWISLVWSVLQKLILMKISTAVNFLNLLYPIPIKVLKFLNWEIISPARLVKRLFKSHAKRCCNRWHAFLLKFAKFNSRKTFEVGFLAKIDRRRK